MGPWLNENSEDEKEVGTAGLADKSCAGRPSASVNPDNKTKADVLMRADRRITLDELASELGVSHGNYHNIVCWVTWVFKSVCLLGTKTHKHHDKGCNRLIWVDNCRNLNTHFLTITFSVPWKKHWEVIIMAMMKKWKQSRTGVVSSQLSFTKLRYTPSFKGGM